MKINYSPIVLFVYNRPWHTRETIEALQKNELANDSELIIYSDGAKNKQAEKAVNEVRNYIKQIIGFKYITIIERDKNWGLANSIIDGVTSVVNQYGKIIVLEDDLVTSPYFLKYMNDALDFYENEKRVMHISGWSYPIEPPTHNDVFLYRIMDCWGWGTWKEDWQCFEKNTNELMKKFSKQDIHRFNLDGKNNLWEQVLLNKYKKINTWAIYWYASIFNQRGLCLTPTHSFVRNIGHDGSGIHCDDPSYTDNINLNTNKNIKFITHITESNEVLIPIKQYFQKQQKSVFIRVIRKLIKNNFILKYQQLFTREDNA